MATRTPQAIRIEAVAGRIVDIAQYEDDLRAEAERINAGEGWTFDTASSAAGGNNYLHHTGVKLDAWELDQAYQLAQRWIAGDMGEWTPPPSRPVGRPREHQEPRQDVRVSLPVDLITQLRAASQVGNAAPNVTAFMEQSVRRALMREVWLIGLVNDWFAIRAERTDDGLWSPVVTRKRTGEDVYIGGEDDPDCETYAEAIDQGERLLRDQVERGNL